MVSDVIFYNLEAELARARISKAYLAKMLGITASTISSKTTGKTEFTLAEMQAIKKTLETATESEFTLDYLFKKS